MNLIKFLNMPCWHPETDGPVIEREMMYAMSKTCKRLLVGRCLKLQETPSEWYEGDSRPTRKRRRR